MLVIEMSGILGGICKALFTLFGNIIIKIVVAVPLAVISGICKFIGAMLKELAQSIFEIIITVPISIICKIIKVIQ